MIASLVCPRCKAENASAQRFCQKCGFGLVPTGTLVPGDEAKSVRGWLGRTISGKYKVLSILGEGGFGTVFQVEQVLLGENNVFALKLLHEELARDDHYRQRFCREASLAMDLVHPNAITVRDFGSTDTGLPYFTMDYCRGESLKDTLSREGFLILNRAIAITVQILKVLEIAHEKQIIHRDLKPENIFLERDSSGLERVKVGDFGLARSVAPNSDEGSGLTKGGIVGTPGYMSPEQARGEPLDARSDLYSIGVLLFEMVSGDLPPRLDKKRPGGHTAHGDSPALALLRERIPANLVVPTGVLNVIARSLEGKPSARYQSATEFREALQLLPTYTPTYVEPEARRPEKRGGTQWVLLSFMLLFASASLLLFFDESRSWVREQLAAVGVIESGEPKPASVPDESEGTNKTENASVGNVDPKSTESAAVIGLADWVPYQPGQELKFQHKLVRPDGTSTLTDEVFRVEAAGDVLRVWRDGQVDRWWRITAERWEELPGALEPQEAPSSAWKPLLCWSGDAPLASWQDAQRRWTYSTRQVGGDLGSALEILATKGEQTKRWLLYRPFGLMKYEAHNGSVLRVQRTRELE